MMSDNFYRKGECTLLVLQTFEHSILSRGVVLSQMRGEVVESPKPHREAFLSRTGYVEPTATGWQSRTHPESAPQRILLADSIVRE
jgi:hypothetical protein